MRREEDRIRCALCLYRVVNLNWKTKKKAIATVSNYFEFVFWCIVCMCMCVLLFIGTKFGFSFPLKSAFARRRQEHFCENIQIFSLLFIYKSKSSKKATNNLFYKYIKRELCSVKIIEHSRCFRRCKKQQILNQKYRGKWLRIRIFGILMNRNLAEIVELLNVLCVEQREFHKLNEFGTYIVQIHCLMIIKCSTSRYVRRLARWIAKVHMQWCAHHLKTSSQNITLIAFNYGILRNWFTFSVWGDFTLNSHKHLQLSLKITHRLRLMHSSISIRSIQFCLMSINFQHSRSIP